MQTLDTLGPVPPTTPTTPAEAATIRANLRRLARDEADAELLCAAIVGVG